MFYGSKTWSVKGKDIHMQKCIMRIARWIYGASLTNKSMQ